MVTLVLRAWVCLLHRNRHPLCCCAWLIALERPTTSYAPIRFVQRDGSQHWYSFASPQHPHSPYRSTHDVHWRFFLHANIILPSIPEIDDSTITNGIVFVPGSPPSSIRSYLTASPSTLLSTQGQFSGDQCPRQRCQLLFHRDPFHSDPFHSAPRLWKVRLLSFAFKHPLALSWNHFQRCPCIPVYEW